MQAMLNNYTKTPDKHLESASQYCLNLQEPAFEQALVSCTALVSFFILDIGIHCNRGPLARTHRENDCCGTGNRIASGEYSIL